MYCISLGIVQFAFCYVFKFAQHQVLEHTTIDKFQNLWSHQKCFSFCLLSKRYNSINKFNTHTHEKKMQEIPKEVIYDCIFKFLTIKEISTLFLVERELDNDRLWTTLTNTRYQQDVLEKWKKVPEFANNQGIPKILFKSLYQSEIWASKQTTMYSSPDYLLQACLELAPRRVAIRLYHETWYSIIHTTGNWLDKTFIIRNEDESIISKIEMDNGHLVPKGRFIGKSLDYSRYEGCFNNNRYDGTWKWFDDKKRICKIENYRTGLFVNKIHFSYRNEHFHYVMIWFENNTKYEFHWNKRGEIKRMWIKKSGQKLHYEFY